MVVFNDREQIAAAWFENQVVFAAQDSDDGLAVEIIKGVFKTVIKPAGRFFEAPGLCAPPIIAR